MTTQTEDMARGLRWRAGVFTLGELKEQIAQCDLPDSAEIVAPGDRYMDGLVFTEYQDGTVTLTAREDPCAALDRRAE